MLQRILAALVLGLASGPAATSIARADSVVVTIENTSTLDGFFLTPVWVAAHDGSFDIWSGGELASSFPGLEPLAEDGDTAPIGMSFETSPAGLAGGQHTTITADTVPAPVFSPGEARTFVFDIGDPTINRFFSYASMVVPSNDLFVATSVPTTHEMFDTNGDFNGTFTIEIFGNSVVDAGTEVNDIAGGAAFSTGGGSPVDESNPLADIYVLDPSADYLNTIVGTSTPTGATIGSIFAEPELIARITIKQVPSPRLRVTIENLEPAGGFFFTPVWIAAHDGQFDIWSSGQLANDFPGLEELAEEGNTGPIDDAFLLSPAGQNGGVAATVAATDVAPPVFNPGETAIFDLDVGDPTVNRFFSYGSMVVPSNDLFFATSVPTTNELYDVDGNFIAPIVIEIRGNAVVDAGTEVNNIAGGAAFSTEGGMALTESNPLADIYDLDPAAVYLQTILGTGTPAGVTIDSFFATDDIIARITVEQIVPAEFIRGDVNADGNVGISDGVDILNRLFGVTPGGFTCEQAADINDSAVVDVADAVIILTYLFLGGNEPPAPFPACGVDATPDLLTCDDFAACP